MAQNVDLNRISDFHRIVEFGNITRAAEAMGETKAKLSRNLALLEQDLGVQLVYRTTRQFRMTELGSKFYKETKAQIEELEASIQGLRDLDEVIEGKIRVTAPEDLGNDIVTGIISEFKKLHPKTSFELMYSNEMLDLVKLGIQVAFRIGNLKDSSLIHKKVGRVDFILVAAPSYLEKNAAVENPEDISSHEIIGFTRVEQEHWQLSSGSSRRKVKISPTISANNFSSVIDLAVFGHGLAFVPKFLTEKYLANGSLVRVMKTWGGNSGSVQVVMPQQKKVPVAVREFFDYSTKKLATIL